MKKIIITFTCIALNAIACFGASSPVPVKSSVSNVYDTLYENCFVATNKINVKFINESFDIDNVTNSAYLLEAMNKPLGIGVGRYEANNVMATIVYANPTKGILWLLNNYTNFNSAARWKMADSLKLVDYVEVYRLIFKIIEDKSVINKVNMKALGDDYDPVLDTTRVCDEVRGTIEYIFRIKLNDPQYTFDQNFLPETESVQDAKVAAIVAWWNARSSTFLAARPRLSANDPALAAKVDDFCRKH